MKKGIAFLVFFVFWVGFLFFSGTLFSGYHFTDDHEILSIYQRIQETDILNTIEYTIVNDLKIRFRPLYYVHRTLLASLFKTNFLWYSIHNMILAVLSSYFLFLFIYRQNYSLFLSILFVFIVLLGSQSEIWWRLGPSETIGFFFLSLSLYLLVNSIYFKNRSQLIFSCIFMILASLSKESFTLFISGFISIFLWLSQQQTGKTFFKIIRENILFIGSLTTVLIIEILLIIFYVGTNKIGYAGVDDSVNIISLIQSIFSYFRHSRYTLVIVLGIFLLLQSVKSWSKILSIDFNKLRGYFFDLIILLIIILPQFFLYAKSGFKGRYLLPLCLGLSYYIFSLLKAIYSNNQINTFSKNVFIISIVFILFSFFKNGTTNGALYYTYEGRATNNLLNEVIENTQSNDSILVVLNSSKNYEWGYSIKTYMQVMENQHNVYYYLVEENEEFNKHLHETFKNNFKDKIVDEIGDSFSSVVIFPFDNNHLVSDKLDVDNNYKKSNFDLFKLYIRKPLVDY